MLSPRSRGKGSRRYPGRDGGRRKAKLVYWRKQATHAVDNPAELSGNLVELKYSCRFSLSAGESIYLFDQLMARAGIRYHAQLHMSSRQDLMFSIRVPAPSAAVTTAIIATLGRMRST